jgi:hypothetical protein
MKETYKFEIRSLEITAANLKISTAQNSVFLSTKLTETKSAVVYSHYASYL